MVILDEEKLIYERSIAARIIVAISVMSALLSPACFFLIVSNSSSIHLWIKILTSIAFIFIGIWMVPYAGRCR